MSRGATEKGYTAKMLRNIVGMEQNYRRNKDETMHVFSDKGDIIASFAGKGASVRFDKRNVPPNSIITHNHPRSLGASGVGRIGNSFSKDDIVSAVGTNAKEMRAVTPTYTFSVKRPKGGWKMTEAEVAKAYSAAEKKVWSDNVAYLKKEGHTSSGVARANISHYHKVMKELAKKFGWDYSKKNN